jgi:2-C-methyl-D-erythritol 4-phosphate cytidylyltransferase
MRLGAELPKAFVLIGPATLLEHAAARFLDHAGVRDVVVVAPADRLAEAAILVPGATVVAGGALRQDSVAAGLAALAEDVDAVLVHDVARPFVPAEVIGRVLGALADGADAVIPAVPVTDTIKQVDGQHVVATINRAELVAVQTPQGFRRSVLAAAHAGEAGGATDDAALVELAGGRVVVVAGAAESFKITTRWDLQVAEAVVAHD